MVIRASGDRWHRLLITRIEDLKDGVHGAGLDAMQLSPGTMHGSLAFATLDDVTYSTGYLGGQVAVTGPLSPDRVTLGLGIDLRPGSRQWLGEVGPGSIGIFLPGEPHQGLFTAGSTYACATLSAERLEAIAADLELVLDRKQLGGSGIVAQMLPRHALGALQRQFARVHCHRVPSPPPDAGRPMLDALVTALGRAPRPIRGGPRLSGHGRIVARANDYILANLAYPLSVRAIARAAFASQSTLYRAFSEILAETPQSFVRKLRLNRIRRDLASEAELRCTITMIANRWGIGELGRLAGWYRELFDELPSQTRARSLATIRDVALGAGARAGTGAVMGAATGA